jgi:hypothetical protein
MSHIQTNVLCIIIIISDIVNMRLYEILEQADNGYNKT